MGAVRSLHESAAPLDLANVDLVKRRDPDDAAPLVVHGADLPGYINIVREGLGAKDGDADVILEGIADILDAMVGGDERPNSAALYALARFQRHALADPQLHQHECRGLTVEPKTGGA